MSQILNKMEQRELIVRTPSEKDKSKVYISLSEKGMEHVKQTRYEKEEWLKGAIEQSLSKEEMHLLEKALPVLRKLAESE